MTTVTLADLASLEATLAAPSAPSPAEVVATVTMAPAPEVPVVETEQKDLPAFTEAPNPPIAGVPRHFTDEERAEMAKKNAKFQEYWKKVYEEARAALIAEGEVALQEEARLENQELKLADIEARLLAGLKSESYQELLAEILAENEDIKEIISKMDIKLRHEASFARVQEYWTETLKKYEDEKIQRETQ